MTRCCEVRTMVHGGRVPMVGSWEVGTRNLDLLLVRVEAGGSVQVVRRLLVVPPRPLHPSRALHRHHQVPRCAPGSPCHLGHSTLFGINTPLLSLFTPQAVIPRVLSSRQHNSHGTAPAEELSVAAVASKSDVTHPLRLSANKISPPAPRPTRDTGHDKEGAPLGEVGDTAPRRQASCTKHPLICYNQA